MYVLVNLFNFFKGFVTDAKSNRVQTHTVCTIQIDENRHNSTINREVGGRTTGLQTHF